MSTESDTPLHRLALAVDEYLESLGGYSLQPVDGSYPVVWRTTSLKPLQDRDPDMAYVEIPVPVALWNELVCERGRNPSPETLERQEELRAKVAREIDDGTGDPGSLSGILRKIFHGENPDFKHAWWKSGILSSHLKSVVIGGEEALKPDAEKFTREQMDSIYFNPAPSKPTP